MLPFLEMPCDDSGTTGGDDPLNFGYSSMSAEEILAAVVLLGYSDVECEKGDSHDAS